MRVRRPGPRNGGGSNWLVRTFASSPNRFVSCFVLLGVAILYVQQSSESDTSGHTKSESNDNSLEMMAEDVADTTGLTVFECLPNELKRRIVSYSSCQEARRLAQTSRALRSGLALATLSPAIQLVSSKWWQSTTNNRTWLDDLTGDDDDDNSDGDNNDEDRMPTRFRTSSASSTSNYALSKFHCGQEIPVLLNAARHIHSIALRYDAISTTTTPWNHRHQRIQLFVVGHSSRTHPKDTDRTFENGTVLAEYNGPPGKNVVTGVTMSFTPNETCDTYYVWYTTTGGTREFGRAARTSIAATTTTTAAVRSQQEVLFVNNLVVHTQIFEENEDYDNTAGRLPTKAGWSRGPVGMDVGSSPEPKQYTSQIYRRLCDEGVVDLVFGLVRYDHQRGTLAAAASQLIHQFKKPSFSPSFPNLDAINIIVGGFCELSRISSQTPITGCGANGGCNACGNQFLSWSINPFR